MRPNFPDAYYDSAILFETKKMNEKALKYYKMVLQLQPDHYDAICSLILLNKKLGCIDEHVELGIQ